MARHHGVFRFSWKWRKRSAIKIMERMHEEATEALYAGRESRHDGLRRRYSTAGRRSSSRTERLPFSRKGGPTIAPRSTREAHISFPILGQNAAGHSTSSCVGSAGAADRNGDRHQEAGTEAETGFKRI